MNTPRQHYYFGTKLPNDITMIESQLANNDEVYNLRLSAETFVLHDRQPSV